MDLGTDGVGQAFPAIPIVFGHAIFDRDNRIALAQIFVEANHCGRIEFFALAFQIVNAVLEELGGGRIKRQLHMLARAIACGLYGAHDETQGFVGGFEVWREAAFIADVGVVAGVFQCLAQRVKNFGSHAQRLTEGRRADWQDHKLLKVDGIVGVRTAVDDVHERHGQDVGVRAADIAKELLSARECCGMRRRQRDTQNGVGAKAAFVGRTVKIDQCTVDMELLFGLHPGNGVEDFAVHRSDGIFNALAAVSFATIAALDGFVGAG